MKLPMSCRVKTPPSGSRFFSLKVVGCLFSAAVGLSLGCASANAGQANTGRAGVGFSGNVAMGNTCVIVVDSDGDVGRSDWLGSSHYAPDPADFC